MTVKEKIAYLRGLIEGSDFFGKDQNARAIWEKLLEISEDLANSVGAMGTAQEEMEEYLEAVDIDLADLEEEVYGELEHEHEDYVEMECPNCHEAVTFEEDLLYDDDVEVSCPECGAVIFIGDDYTDDDLADDGEVDAD